MRRAAGCLVFLVSACGELWRPPPTPPPPSADLIPLPPPYAAGEQVNRVIVAGEKAEGLINPHDRWMFELTAPTNGMVVARLTWDTRLGVLELGFGDRWLKGDGLIVVKIPVVAGEVYRLTVGDGFPWENYGTKFVLETPLE